MSNPIQPSRAPDPGNAAAPDPATSYERARPEAEAGQGRMDNPAAGAVPSDNPDLIEQAVGNAQPPRQINAQEVVDARQARGVGDQRPAAPPPRPPAEADHSMLEEEPLGEDLMPLDIHDPRHKRHSRSEGKGGTR